MQTHLINTANILIIGADETLPFEGDGRSVLTKKYRY